MARAAQRRIQDRLGVVPYYMFVERDTGPRDYFAVPLARGLRIYRERCARCRVWPARWEAMAELERVAV